MAELTVGCRDNLLVTIGQPRRSVAAQLGAGEPTHGRQRSKHGYEQIRFSSFGFRISGRLPLRLGRSRRPHRRARDPPDAARRAGVVVAGLPGQMSGWGTFMGAVRMGHAFILSASIPFVDSRRHRIVLSQPPAHR